MKIYHYHPEYKYFICDEDANPSPSEPGAYLIPAHATDIEPPTCEEGYIQVFNGTSWNIVEDSRGLYWDKETLMCHNIENPCACCDHLTKEIPPFENRMPNQVIKWNNGWIIEDLPEPEIPEPIIDEENLFENMTLEEKLAAVGLTVDEIRNYFGLTP